MGAENVKSEFIVARKSIFYNNSRQDLKGHLCRPFTSSYTSTLSFNARDIYEQSKAMKRLLSKHWYFTNQTIILGLIRKREESQINMLQNSKSDYLLSLSHFPCYFPSIFFITMTSVTKSKPMRLFFLQMTKQHDTVKQTYLENRKLGFRKWYFLIERKFYSYISSKARVLFWATIFLIIHICMISCTDIIP